MITDVSIDYLNFEITNCSTLFNIRYSLKVSHAPWTNGFVEEPKQNLGTNLRRFVGDTPGNWSIQRYFFAFAHNSQPLSELHF